MRATLSWVCCQVHSEHRKLLALKRDERQDMTSPLTSGKLFPQHAAALQIFHDNGNVAAMDSCKTR
ncbi:MAG: hypothetical protein ABI142_11620 [Bryocella sp.]